MSKFIPIIILSCISAFSQTTSTGNISGMTFKPSGNPWIVKENVFIENGSKTVIKPGCVFLFKPFSGIIVQGSLAVEGNTGAPVVFTSINDSACNEASTQQAEPFDWNGILIERTAEMVKMTNFILSYSVYGLKSKKEDVVLERGIFRQNGQFHFTINDKIQEVESNLPFSYSTTEKSSKLPEKPSIGWAKPVGIGAIVTGTAFLGIMGYFVYSGFDLNRKYENSGDKDGMYSYLGKRDAAVRNSVITGIIGGILVPAGTGILLWGNKTEKSAKTVSIYPIAGEKHGLCYILRF